MLDHFLRYYDILRLARLRAGDLVLEVGSGPRGIGEFYAGRFVGCDLNFFEKPVLNMRPVRGSAMHLPFADRSFDTVISSDMIEHLAWQDRRDAIAELVRVSRGKVVLGCPHGKSAFLSDVVLAKYYALRKLTPPGWLSEHVATTFPDRRHIETVLNEIGVSYKVHRNESVLFHQSMMLAGTLPLLGRILPLFATRFKHVSVLFLRLTGRIGPPYRSLFVIYGTRD